MIKTVKIKKIKNSTGCEATHTDARFPHSPAVETVLWFALGWKPTSKDCVHL